MAKHTTIKIWQANTDRARHCTDELRKAAYENNVDIILVQEPYAVRGKVMGYGMADTLITGTQQGEQPWAAIIVLNKELNILHLQHLCTAHTVAAEVTTNFGAYIVVSCYMQYSRATADFISELRPICQAYQNHKYIIGTDSNAKSRIWGSPIEDEAGNIIADFLAEERLIVLNDPTCGPTYETDLGSSYIDITITNTRARNLVRSWTLKPEILTGSHKVIELTLEPLWQ